MRQPKKILVIEDNNHIREVIADLLVDEGYDVTEVVNAVEALKLLGNMGFDLITLDLRLPGGMSGLDFLEELTRLNGTLSTIPVIVVSANANWLKQHPQVKQVIPKPFDLIELSEGVQQWA